MARLRPALNDELGRLNARPAGSGHRRVLHGLELHRIRVYEYVHGTAAEDRASRRFEVCAIG
jgi:hypothetical protein